MVILRWKLADGRIRHYLPPSLIAPQKAYGTLPIDPSQDKRLFAAKSRMPERQGLTIFDVKVF
jgi:hypothetical protein